MELLTLGVTECLIGMIDMDSKVLASAFRSGIPKAEASCEGCDVILNKNSTSEIVITGIFLIE